MDMARFHAGSQGLLGVVRVWGFLINVLTRDGSCLQVVASWAVLLHHWEGEGIVIPKSLRFASFAKSFKLEKAVEWKKKDMMKGYFNQFIRGIILTNETCCFLITTDGRNKNLVILVQPNRTY